MGNNMDAVSVADVEAKYTYLEEYMRDYVEMLAYNAQRKLIFFIYFRNHGIVLPTENPYKDFPSYDKWLFHRMRKITPFSFSS